MKTGRVTVAETTLRWNDRFLALTKANREYLCPRTDKPCRSGYSNWCPDCTRFMDCMPPAPRVRVTERVRWRGFMYDRLPQSVDDGEGDCG